MQYDEIEVLEVDRDGETLVEKLREEGHIYSSKVARAFRAVPRERFVPEEVRDRAYDDVPLDIGEGQTISAPHVVADVTELLELKAGRKVLEVGTGSGYHAAITAEIAGASGVFTIERLPSLAKTARANLDDVGYDDVSVIIGDGSRGLSGIDPFERIYLTCAVSDVPEPLIEQLADGGRIVAPIGYDAQRLVVIEKRGDRVERTPYGMVQFVPLVGDYGVEAE